MNLSPAVLVHSIASFQSQVLGSLFGNDASSGSDLFSSLLAQKTPSSDPSSDSAALFGVGSQGLSPSGRNLSLFDPESAYKMMSLINNRDALYKAQYSELGQMSAGVAAMQTAGLSLGHITDATAPAGVEALLQNFAAQYNHWRQQFSPDVQKGGVLDGTQAAQVSLYELEQSVKNPFFGAKDGVRGLGDLGFSIDPATGLAKLDSAKLQATLGANPQGALSAIHDFSANFAKSAGLLNADNNFIPNQLDNLGRAIHYIASNKASLTQEFGAGDPAKPTGQVARALAAYNQTYA